MFHSSPIIQKTLLDYVRTHPLLKYTRLIAYGQSIGGAVAIDLVARNEEAFAGLIVENTFLSVVSIYNCPVLLSPMKSFSPLEQHIDISVFLSPN